VTWPGSSWVAPGSAHQIWIVRESSGTDLRLRFTILTKWQAYAPCHRSSIQLKLGIKELHRRSAMLAQPVFPVFGLGIKEIFDGAENVLPLGVCLHGDLSG